jgi:hypothetical protein
MSNTVIAKGNVVNNPSLNNIGRANFVRCTATGATQTIEVRGIDSTVLGQVYLHAAGDTVIIEKHPDDKITMADGHASAVGSPRS